MFMLVFLSVDWVVVYWNCDYMRLDDDWVSEGLQRKTTITFNSDQKVADDINLRYFDWNVHWEGNLHFLDDLDFDFLIDGIFFNVMVICDVVN